MKLVLRGHHLLCLQGFQGYGYDSDFVENMTHINEIRKNPKTIIEIVDYADDICKDCPNLKNNVCLNEKQNCEIILKDQKVLEKIPNKKYFKSDDLFNIINKTFNSADSLKEICLNCQWHDKCLFIKNIIKK